MFRSIDFQSGEEIIILDRAWNRKTIENLRSRSRENSLICPECRQPVLVKAGRVKRWHFAHQDLGNCPLRNESSTILQARSLLYIWLSQKYPQRVTIEKSFSQEELPRPVDCYVEPKPGKKFAYWILEAGLRSRAPLISAFQRLHIRIHWVFLSNMLRLDDTESPPSVLLTPTEREFAYESEYNSMYSSSVGDAYSSYAPYTDAALNYLNLEEHTLITLRGLWCIHSPGQYLVKKKLVEKLANMLISPKTGEFIYPGEYQQLQAHREAQRKAREEENQRKEKERRERQEQQQRAQQANRLFMQRRELAASPREKTDRQPSTVRLYQSYTCEMCGASTTDWVELHTATNTCICRECLKQRHQTPERKQETILPTKDVKDTKKSSGKNNRHTPEKMFIGYSGFHPFDEAYAYHENACYIADTATSLQESLEWGNWPVEEYRIDPISIADIRRDFGGSLGEYALEPDALRRFEKAANALGIEYTVKPYDSIFDSEPTLFLVILTGTFAEILDEES